MITFIILFLTGLGWFVHCVVQHPRGWGVAVKGGLAGQDSVSGSKTPFLRPQFRAETALCAFGGYEDTTRGGLVEMQGMHEVCNATAKGVKSLFSGRTLVMAWNEVENRVTGAISAINEALSGDDEWIPLSPIGEFPNPVGLQILDHEAHKSMVDSFNSLSGKLARLFKGLPIYVGHPDDAVWRRENPGIYNRYPHPVGRVKEMKLEDGRAFFKAAWNEEGKRLVSGDAAPLSQHSPHWGMLPLGQRNGKKAFRPVQLFSIGLTENPNIPDNYLGVNESKELQPAVNYGTSDGARKGWETRRAAGASGAGNKKAAAARSKMAAKKGADKQHPNDAAKISRAATDKRIRAQRDLEKNPKSSELKAKFRSAKAQETRTHNKFLKAVKTHIKSKAAEKGQATKQANKEKAAKADQEKTIQDLAQFYGVYH